MRLFGKTNLDQKFRSGWIDLTASLSAWEDKHGEINNPQINHVKGYYFDADGFPTKLDDVSKMPEDLKELIIKKVEWST